MGKYWYYVSYYYCPICGRTEEIKVRQYTPRPDAYEDRHSFTEAWDYCDIG